MVQAPTSLLRSSIDLVDLAVGLVQQRPADEKAARVGGYDAGDVRCCLFAGSGEVWSQDDVPGAQQARARGNRFLGH